MEPRKFAPRRIHLTTAFVATLMSVMLLGVVVLLPKPVSTILVIPALATSLFLIARSFRISLEVSERQLTVKNYWRTYRFSWAEVRRVGMREASGVWATGPVPVLIFQLSTRSRPVEAHATRWLGEQTTKERLVGLISLLAPRETVVDVSASRFY